MKVGDKVIIVLGQLSGKTASIIRVDGHGNCLVLVNKWGYGHNSGIDYLRRIGVVVPSSLSCSSYWIDDNCLEVIE